MNKSILVLGAGEYLKKNISLLRDAGFYCHVVDRDPNAPGAVLADQFAPIDISDSEAVTEYAATHKVNGIMPLNEHGIRSAAKAGQTLGLKAVSPKTAELTCDKGLMRQAWAEARLASPRFRVVEDKSAAFDAASTIGFPCVFKPADSGGSGRGISVVQNRDDIEWAYDFAIPFARNSRIVIEEFLDGIEMTIESLTVDGKTHILAMSDKVKPEIRTRVATSLNYPANFPEEILAAVRELVCDALDVLGIEMGMGHTEVIVTENGPMLVEAAARGGGGHVFHTIIEAVSGVSAPVQFARLLTGLSPEMFEIKQRGCVYRFFNPEKGILQKVSNVDKAVAMEGVLDLGILKKTGEQVGELSNSLHRAGFVVTEGINRSQAVARADAVEQAVVFHVEK